MIDTKKIRSTGGKSTKGKRPKIPLKDIDGIQHKCCRTCDIFKPTTDFNKSSQKRLKCKLLSICKVCNDIKRKENHLTMSGRYKQLICLAKCHGRQWDISYEDFQRFWQKPCTYCGGEIATCSLDRVDSSKEYSLNNVSPACIKCNWAKMDKTIDELTTNIDRLYHNIENIKILNIAALEYCVKHCFICGELNSTHAELCKAHVRKPGSTKANRIRNYLLPREKYSNYKGQAVNRNIKWDLSKDDFISMWKEPCYYCGAEISTIGIDRIDNCHNIGYCKSNVVSACIDCNQFKMNLTLDEFIFHIEKVYYYFVKSNVSGR